MRRSYVLTAVSLGLGLAGLALAWYREHGTDKRNGIALSLADLSQDRLFEPRLTTNLTYAPCTVASKPGRLLPAVRCSRDSGVEISSPEDAAGDFEPMSDGAVDEAGARRTRGSSGIVASTVAKLERAVSERPGDAHLLSDLAAAYFIRAHEADEPEDLIRALDAAARACETNPALDEALFNRALTLERLHLRQVALEAWAAYLKVDDSSEWAEEARQRRDTLRKPSLSDRWPDLRARLDAVALKGNKTKAIVELAPQMTREYAMEELLPQWGHAFLAGDSGIADRSLRIAAAVGSALEASTGEATVQRAILAIESKPSATALRSLAQGHEALGEGLLLFRKLDTKSAQTPLRIAREELRRGGSPAEQWALCGLARCWAYDGRFEEAEGAFLEIAERAKDEDSSSLAGWAQWGLGWLDVRRRRFSNALGRFGLAERAYEKAREKENLGAVRHFLGENLFLLGQDRAGWRFRYRALANLADFPNSFRRHNLLLEGAYAAFTEKLHRASLLLEEEDVRIAKETRDPIIYTEALRARGRLQLELGLQQHRVDQAWRDLESAQRSSRMAPESSPGRKLLADSLWVEGEALRLRNPAAALEPLSQAMSEYQKLKTPLSVIQALLSRYRAYLALDRDAEAEVDLTAALQILEDPGASIREEDLKLSYAESIQNVYDEMIDFRWRKFRDGIAALDLLLRAQAFYQLDATGREAVRLNPPSQRVVVAYALLKDRLLRWLIRDGKISTVERSIGIRTVESKVARLTGSLQDTKASEELYDLLVPTSIADLSDNQVVYFVPDKSLNRIPFAALRNPKTGRFLIEEHPVAVTPNLLALGNTSQLATIGAHPSVLLVGNPVFDRKIFPALPSLDNARAEMASIASLFPGSLILSEANASRARVLDKLDQAEAFIFVGHAVANASLPSRSYLVLAPSSDPPDAGLLLSDDIVSRKFKRLRLVVLSACSTVGPRSTRTAGVAGFAEPFLRAGVENVIGTLWPIDDRKAGELLATFYRELARGQPAVTALRHAQLAALQSSRVSGHPVAEWAAFELVSN